MSHTNKSCYGFSQMSQKYLEIKKDNDTEIMTLKTEIVRKTVFRIWEKFRLTAKLKELDWKTNPCPLVQPCWKTENSLSLFFLFYYFFSERDFISPSISVSLFRKTGGSLLAQPQQNLSNICLLGVFSFLRQAKIFFFIPILVTFYPIANYLKI